MKRLAITFAAVAMIALPMSAFALSNGGFETDDTSGGDVYCASSWNCFNDVFSSSMSAPPRTGNNVLKIFGPFAGPGGGAGAVQAVPAAPGQTWVGEIWAMDWQGDAIQGNDFGVYKIEFLDAGFNLVAGGVAGVDVFESNQITAAAADDTWTLLGVGTAPAPAGTVWAQAVIVKVALDGFNGGSIFWDDASLFQDTPTATEETTWGQVKTLFR